MIHQSCQLLRNAQNMRNWLATVLLGLAFNSSTHAFGAEGHSTVGAIADQLLAGSNAAAQVNTILGGLSLQNAAVWADCAKNVNPSQNYTYSRAGSFKARSNSRSAAYFTSCTQYETHELQAEMSDFVRRNDTNCARKPSEESCHKQYHYSDVAVQRKRYAKGLTGTRRDDVVAAVAAASRVLQGGTAPAPFNIKNKREALFILAHTVGDIHQPLHVGAVYLSASGKRVNPDTGVFNPQTETRGGNQLVVSNQGASQKRTNFHHLWDEIPAAQTAAHINQAWLTRARATPITPGAVFDWSSVWANETLHASQQAFSGLKFSPRQNGEWHVSLPANYAEKMASIKEQQLTKAGARLAQVLQAIWP
jgi:hypothetical protein